MTLGITDSTPRAMASTAPAGVFSRHFFTDGAAWIRSARFLTAWIFPASLALYLKWYLLVDQSGFERVARSQGLRTLALYTSIGFFRDEFIVVLVAIPLGLLIVNRFLRPALAATFTALACLLVSLVVGVQILSLKELGRFSSFKMLAVAASWGWHEPGANARYLASVQGLAVGLALAGVIAAVLWASRSARNPSLIRPNVLKTGAELYLFLILATLLYSTKSVLPPTPYHEGALRRAFASLKNDGLVESSEVGAFDLSRGSMPPAPDFAGLSEPELIERYQKLVNLPPASAAPAYFGKEAGANVLFFVLETTPQKYLPVGTDLTRLPNFNSLQDRAFIGTRHYTTFPVTHSALFSVFTSWYPIDDPADAYDSPSWEAANGLVRRLEAEGYKANVFSPLHSPGIPDDALFDAVGFQKQVYPAGAVTTFDEKGSWQEARIAADLETLRLLEVQLDQWMKHGDKFVAAFLPQITHAPYPDRASGDSVAELQSRAEALIQREDAWMGEILALLRKDGQLDNTIIVVVGDHGLRSISENPDMRRGTIDETAFHVPLLIRAPRALDHAEKISWLTSHIDVTPTLLDLLGVKGNRESEQGTAIWNPAIAQRTTFFFAKPMFGADGYTTDGQFYMWHYFSDTIYQKPVAEFDPSDILPRRSPVAQTVTGDITTMVGIEHAWHRKFSVPGVPPAKSAKSQSPDD